MDKFHFQKQKIERLEKQVEKLKKGNGAYVSYPASDDEICDDAIFDEEESIDDWQLSKADFEKKRHSRNREMANYLSKYQPTFPEDIFPKVLIDHAKDVERCLNYPFPYYMAGMLLAISTAIGANFKALIAPGKESVASLMMAIVGNPNINKTSPLFAALKPIIQREKLAMKEYKKEMTEYESLSTEGRKEKRPPTLKRYITDNFTMEALIQLAIVNKRGMLACSDELAGIIKGMNMYRKGNDEELWLQIFNGLGIRVDRVEKQHITPALFVNMGGTIQTEVIQNFIASSPANNGFFDRLLYVCPIDDCDPKWTKQNMSVELEERYHDLVNVFLDISCKVDEDGNVIPVVLTYTNNALTAIIEWQNSNVDDCKKINSPQLVGIAKKLEIYAGRFALILALVDYASRCPALLLSGKKIVITESHVNKAVSLCRYFLHSAQSLLAMMPEKTNIAKANPDMLRFYDRLPQCFDLQNAIRVASMMEISERTVYYYLRSDYFRKVARGKYEKLFHKQ